MNSNDGTAPSQSQQPSHGMQQEQQISYENSYADYFLLKYDTVSFEQFLAGSAEQPDLLHRQAHAHDNPHVRGLEPQHHNPIYLWEPFPRPQTPAWTEVEGFSSWVRRGRAEGGQLQGKDQGSERQRTQTRLPPRRHRYLACMEQRNGGLDGSSGM